MGLEHNTADTAFTQGWRPVCGIFLALEHTRLSHSKPSYIVTVDLLSVKGGCTVIMAAFNKHAVQMRRQLPHGCRT